MHDVWRKRYHRFFLFACFFSSPDYCRSTVSLRERKSMGLFVYSSLCYDLVCVANNTEDIHLESRAPIRATGKGAGCAGELLSCYGRLLALSCFPFKRKMYRLKREERNEATPGSSSAKVACAHLRFFFLKGSLSLFLLQSRFCFLFIFLFTLLISLHFFFSSLL